jgi:hypothetical protein
MLGCKNGVFCSLTNAKKKPIFDIKKEAILRDAMPNLNSDLLGDSGHSSVKDYIKLESTTLEQSKNNIN